MWLYNKLDLKNNPTDMLSWVLKRFTAILGEGNNEPP